MLAAWWHPLALGGVGKIMTLPLLECRAVIVGIALELAAAEEAQHG
jgi:hypothetical protein